MKHLVILVTLLGMLFSESKAYTQSSVYLILTTVSDTADPYYDAVQVLSDYRAAEVVSFEPEDVEDLLPVLSAIAPRYVAVVLKPLELEINFIRKFLMLSTDLDEDPFSDFSYGYITGATAQDVLDFIDRIIQAEAQNIENFPINIGGYAASSINMVYTFASGYMEYLYPPSYSCIYMETSDSGSGRDFFLANSGYMENNKILDIGHNGDAHMLWLFEGGNINPDPPVWSYDPAKIEDPAYARMGISSYDISGLDLYPAVAFNGACHSGETKTVMVEGDIAATFGDTEGIVRFYTMSDTFSFALSILNTGITGYFAPCGANNANDQGEDVYNAFLFDEPLGDIHKRSVDGVVMGYLGNKPNLRIFQEGSSTYYSDVLPSGTFNPNNWPGASSMLGGKANRIYFGDPLFNPYRNNHSNMLNLVEATLDSVNGSTLDIDLTFSKPDGFWPVWDKFHFGDTRIYLPIELPAWCDDVLSLTVIDSSGAYSMVIHAIEHFDGKTILHLEVDIPDDMYSVINYAMTLRANTINAAIITPDYENGSVVSWPNPVRDQLNIRFPFTPGEEYTLRIFDSMGKTAGLQGDIRSEIIQSDIRHLLNGLYLFTLDNGKGKIFIGKFTVGM